MLSTHELGDLSHAPTQSARQASNVGLSPPVLGGTYAGFEPTMLTKSKQDLNSLINFISCTTYFICSGSGNPNY
jgi:hypothetical protein